MFGEEQTVHRSTHARKERRIWDRRIWNGITFAIWGLHGICNCVHKNLKNQSEWWNIEQNERRIRNARKQMRIHESENGNRERTLTCELESVVLEWIGIQISTSSCVRAAQPGTSPMLCYYVEKEVLDWLNDVVCVWCFLLMPGSAVAHRLKIAPPSLADN